MSKYLNEYDYEAIHAQAEYVIKHRKKMKQSAVDKYMKHFDEKCAKSKAATAEAKKSIVGGVQHNLANNHPFALSCVKAEGCCLWDADGNRYLDFLCAGGPTILGNNFPAVKEAAMKLIGEAGGPLTGLYSDYELQMSNLIKKYYPTIDKVRLLGTGSEADVIAIRLARAFTGKKHIIRFNGGYHGWSDQLVYSYGGEDKAAVHCGIPVACYANTHAVPINDLAALEAELKKYDGDGGVAAFIMEAVGQDSGAVPTTREYHKGAEQLCRKYGTLLVYDEVVTGFRLGMGGAQAIFGTKPDITIFGKIIGGGYAPAAAVGARAEIMDWLSAGVTDKSHAQVRVGGTLSANPLSTLAGIVTIQQLEKLDVHAKLDAAAAKFMQGVADITDQYDVPAILFNHQSILHVDIHGLQHLQYFYAPGDPELKTQMVAAYTNILELAMGLAAEGLIVANGGKTYLCYDAIGSVDEALGIYEKVLSRFE
jgi:glutamate-1-semialdehyde 2,1-aminomutase